MKKLYILILLLSFSVGLFAKDSFYYSGDERIPLYEMEGKVVVISPNVDIQIKRESVFSEGRRIKDDRLVINVVSDGSPLVKTMKSMSLPVRTEKCYLDSRGLELIPTGYINLKLKREEDKELLEKRAAEFGLEITEQNEYMPLWFELVINFENDASVIDIAKRLYETGDFASCSPAFSFDGREITYDPYTSDQWGLYNADYDGMDINIVPAWDYATGRGINIAIIDGGVDLTHKDLEYNAYVSKDFETGTSPNTQFDDHATMCAGIAAAERNNDIGIAGVAPDARIMSARVNFSNGSNTMKQLADAINWACENKADVISCSWSASRCKLIEDAIDAAVSFGRSGKGCIFVKSAGNDGGPVTYPGNYRMEVLAIGAIDQRGTRWNKSCYGDSLFLTAPGVDIYTTANNNSIMKGDGTSFACPFVSGVAALILERNPNLDILEVIEILAKSAKKVGEETYSKGDYGTWNQWYGYGLVDAYEAVLNTPRKRGK